jgi:hypothetical protein
MWVVFPLAIMITVAVICRIKANQRNEKEGRVNDTDEKPTTLN